MSFTLTSGQGPTSFGPVFDGSTFYYTNVPVVSDGVTYTREVGFGVFAGDFNGLYPYLYELGVGQNVIVNGGEITVGTVTPVAGLFSYTPFFTGTPGAPVFIPGVYIAPVEGILTITDQTTSITPEPSTFALLGTGLLGIAGLLRKRIS